MEAWQRVSIDRCLGVQRRKLSIGTQLSIAMGPRTQDWMPRSPEFGSRRHD